MSRIIKGSHMEIITEYSRDFEWEGHPNCGYSFPCDEQGNLKELNECALENYNKCVSGTMTFEGCKIIDRGVRKCVRSFRIQPTVECDCGEQFVLWNEYAGACSCPKCEQWYNLFGQQLVNPTMWEEDY